MANFGSVQLFDALNTAKNQGLTIEKVKDGNKDFVDNLPYGEYSLANIAQVTNTIKALAQHIYNNFIPSDRIIPSGATYPYMSSQNVNTTADLIFYKFYDNHGTTTEVSNAGERADNVNFDFRKYLITGENLRENIKYHKPKINGNQNYNENNNFIIPSAPAQDNYTARNGTLYGGKGNTAEFLGVKISQNYVKPDNTTKSSATLGNDNSITLNMSTPFNVDGSNVSANTDTPLTYIDENLNKNTLVISSGGIAKSKTNNNTFINTVSSADRSFTFYSGVANDGTLQTRTVNFSARGLITSITAAAPATGLKVINTSNQTFASGLKTFSGGIGLPSSAGTGSYIYLS